MKQNIHLGYATISWCFLLVIRVIDDKCKFLFWYIEVSAYYVYSLVYLCRSLLEQQIELVLSFVENIEFCSFYLYRTPKIKQKR